ncbi:MAG: hypothetical protein LBU90_06505 [Bacteroidales bacterium]|jgi:lambda repressor-like predicted transcriptional regulator|nr:hypothetical protein [Bacteroidales bacterium]
MPKKQEIHIGNRVCDFLKKEGRSKKWLAEQVGVSSSSLVRTLQHPSMNTHLLLRISKTLKHNFFEIFTKELHDCT